MKRILSFIFVLSTALMLTANGWAEDDVFCDEEGNCYRRIGSTAAEQKHVIGNDFGVAPEIYNYRYAEPEVMKLEGVMYGFSAYYTSHQKMMWTLETRFAWGEADYESEGTGELENVVNFTNETRAIAGMDIVQGRAVYTPYMGVGYRYKSDDMQGRLTNTSAAGFERESQYWYIPMGIEAMWYVGKGWMVGGLAEYDVFLTGEQDSHLADAVPGFSDITNDQDDGYGARFSLKFLKETPTIDWLIEPFWRRWNIDDSEVAPLRFNGTAVGIGWEPNNTTDEVGAKIAAQF